MSASQRIFDAIGAQLILHRRFADVPPRVGDEYEITEIIGAGGFGLICRATQLALHRPVALKLFPLGREHDDGGVREALREARSLARLEHPGIVSVYAAGESEVIAGERLACAYVEMQLIDGVDLREWLATGDRDAGEILRLLCAAGRALAHAHVAGIVHRDFKPENLMVDRSGQAKVIDFGLALVAEAGDKDAALARWDPQADALGARATQTGLIRGTPGYIAPEASQGQPQAASDQFALAVVVREALTGRHPLASDPGCEPPRGGPELFAAIKPIVDRAMAPAPGDRFASVAELCDALEQRGSSTRTRRWPGIAIAAATLGLLGGAAWIGATTFERDEVEAPAKHTRVPAPEPVPPESEPEPAPAPTPSEPPDPEPAPILASSPTSCANLEAWMGTWQATTKVTWTEYAYQFDWRVDYELELELGQRCAVTIIARKFPARVDDEPPGPPLETTASGVAQREAGGVWRLPLRLEFPDDSRTYNAAEHYETVLLLESAGEGATPRLRGAFRKLSEEGLWIRLGLLEGDRGVAPDPRAIATTDLACAARCRIDCAGAAAESDCYARGCAALDHPDDVCGPPSYDFRTPMRAVAARQAIRDGENVLAQAFARGGEAKQRADCAANARTLAGTWGLWLGDELAQMQLQGDGDCGLHGTVTRADERIAVGGYVTAAGTWVLMPDSPPPSWLSQPLILVGAGERGPAFGTDIAEPPRPLRAFRVIARDPE